MKKLLLVLLLLTLPQFASGASMIVTLHGTFISADTGGVLDSIIWAYYNGVDSVGRHDTINVAGIDSVIQTKDTLDSVYTDLTIYWYIYYADGTLDIVAESDPDKEIYINSPGSPDTCVVFLYVQDLGGNLIRGAELSVTMKGRSIKDTCNSRIMGDLNITKQSNSLGLIEVPLVKTKCLSPRKEYNFELSEPGGGVIWKATDSVPDTTTYQLGT